MIRQYTDNFYTRGRLGTGDRYGGGGYGGYSDYGQSVGGGWGGDSYGGYGNGLSDMRGGGGDYGGMGGGSGSGSGGWGSGSPHASYGEPASSKGYSLAYEEPRSSRDVTPVGGMYVWRVERQFKVLVVCLLACSTGRSRQS